MNVDRTRRHVEELWDDSIVPELVEYVRIPNKSPHFDPDWAEHGYMDAAVEHMVRWCEAHALDAMALEVVRLPGRTPLIFIEVPGEGDDCLVLYGHLDKQPEMTGWRDDLGPWSPRSRVIDSTVAGAPMTGTPSTARSPRWEPFRSRGFRTRAAW